MSRNGPFLSNPGPDLNKDCQESKRGATASASGGGRATHAPCPWSAMGRDDISWSRRYGACGFRLVSGEQFACEVDGCLGRRCEFDSHSRHGGRGGVNGETGEGFRSRERSGERTGLSIQLEGECDEEISESRSVR